MLGRNLILKPKLHSADIVMECHQHTCSSGCSLQQLMEHVISLLFLEAAGRLPMCCSLAGLQAGKRLPCLLCRCFDMI